MMNPILKNHWNQPIFFISVLVPFYLFAISFLFIIYYSIN